MKTLIQSGNTFARKDILKKAGWKWVARQKQWTLEITDEQAAVLLRGQNDSAAVELGISLKSRGKGCVTWLTADVTRLPEACIFRSKTFAATPHDNRVTKADMAGDLYNCDQFGNYIGGQQIPGSAPGDLI